MGFFCHVDTYADIDKTLYADSVSVMYVDVNV